MRENINNLPKVSFAIPTLNAANDLPRCLKSISIQDYPKDLIEIIVADGGSNDDTLKIANNFGARVLNNLVRVQEHGKVLAFENACGEIVFFLDADNALPNKNWLKLMVQPFVENKEVMACFTPIIVPKDTNSFDRYFALMHSDPFSFFVYGKAAFAEDFDQIYEIETKKDNYIIYKFTIQNHLLLGTAQGTGLRRSFNRKNEFKNDDVLPIIQIIEEGKKIAYVPNAGCYHYCIKNFRHFLKKMRWRIRNNIIQKQKGWGFVNREIYLNKTRKFKKYLFIPYSLSMVLPIFSAIKNAIRFKKWEWLWHGPATISLGIEIFIEYIKYFLGFEIFLGDYGKTSKNDK
ncbi:MAG: glycosyltransferase [Patescibacteria group bacterium]